MISTIRVSTIMLVFDYNGLDYNDIDYNSVDYNGLDNNGLDDKLIILALIFSIIDSSLDCTIKRKQQ